MIADGIRIMDNDTFDAVALAALGPLTLEEVLAVLDGQNLEAHRAQQLEQADIAEEAEQYRLVSPSEWPPLEFNWDFSEEGQRFALDGFTIESFANCCPSGLRLGWVTLKEFDAHLSTFNRRELSELWTVGDEGKLSRAIAYIRRGKPITPPLVNPMPEAKQVCLGGGNHRYAVAKFSMQLDLPIYVDVRNVEAVGFVLPVRWI